MGKKAIKSQLNGNKKHKNAIKRGQKGRNTQRMQKLEEKGAKVTNKKKGT